MIKSLTIIGSNDEKGNVNYQLSGDLPLDEAARALILFALQVSRPEQKKEEIINNP